MVCEKFDQLYTILEEKKRQMSQKVTAEQEEKVNYIRGLTKKYGDHLEESCKIVEQGIQTMEEPEMALFLQVRLEMGFTWGSNLSQNGVTMIRFYVDVLFLLPLSPLEHKASPQEVSTCFYPSLITVTVGKGNHLAIFKPVPVFTYIGI